MAYTRDEIRQRFYAHAYRWQLHVAAIVLFCLATLSFCAWQIARAPLHAWELGALLGFLVFVNGGEYWIHRWPFHHRVALGLTHLRHTVIHHGYFRHDSMAVESLRDLEWVMLPAWGYPLIVLSMVPLVLLLERAAPGLGWVFLLAMTIYYAVYETAHTVSHLPESWWIARRPLARAISRHHRAHHDPQRMERWNFNFAFPLFDRIHGTVWRDGNGRPDGGS